jgi:hypothetical protein
MELLRKAHRHMLQYRIRGQEECSHFVLILFIAYVTNVVFDGQKANTLNWCLAL